MLYNTSAKFSLLINTISSRIREKEMKGWATGSSSNSQHTPNEKEVYLDEVDEEDDEEDGPMHNENDDYII